MSFCELPVPAFELASPGWREVTLSALTPEHQSQPTADHEFNGFGGGFSYKSEEFSSRFVLWRVFKDVLEISEFSLTESLTHNALRIRFSSPILRSVEMYEDVDEFYNPKVVIFALTASCTLYRFCFEHPSAPAFSPSRCASIFQGVDISALQDSGISIAKPSLPVKLACCSARDASVVFSDGSIVCYGFSDTGAHQEIILQEKTLMQRLWKGFIPGFSKNDACSVDDVCTASVWAGWWLVFVVGVDNKLRIWNVDKRVCVKTIPLLEDDAVEEACIFKRHVRVCSNDADDKGDIRVVVYLDDKANAHFQLYRIGLEGSDLQIELECLSYTSFYGLADFTIMKNRIWAVWNGSESEGAKVSPNYNICYIEIPSLKQASAATELNTWIETFPQPCITLNDSRIDMSSFVPLGLFLSLTDMVSTIF